MKRCVFCLTGWLLLLSSHVAPAAASDATITLEIADSFPLGVPTVMAGQLEDGQSQSSNWKLTDQRLGDQPIVAQREAEGPRVWLAVRIEDQKLLGQEIQVEAAPCDVAPAVTICPQDGGFEFSAQDRKVMFYHKEPVSQEGQYTRANYLHPLRGFQGQVLTEAFPDDHPHHHGIFWAWHQLWVGQQRAGDAWTTEDFLCVVRKADVVEQGPVFATLQIVADWTSPHITDEQGEAQPFVKERTRIRLFDSVEKTQAIDFEIRLKPLIADVIIGGAENERGYSGFTVRLKPPQQMQIREEGRVLDEDAIGRASRWVDVSGQFDGGRNVSGVSILSHPTLPEFPPRWLLRHYGAQNVIYPGRDPVPLSPQDPLVLRHRLLIHQGDAEAASVAEQQRVYESTP